MDETNPKDLIGVQKPQLDLVPPSSIVYQALAMQLGAKKYGPYNWRSKKVKASIYIAACLRHVYSYLDGEDLDTESRSSHLGHALACLGIIIDAKETGNLIDDRPIKGNTAQLLQSNTKEKRNETASTLAF